MRRGEVRWLSGPPGTRRPVLILTRDAAIPLLNKIHVVPATTRIRELPTEVPLTRADGLPKDCALSIDNLQLVEKRAIGRLITVVSGTIIDEVCSRVAFALSC